MLSLIVIMFLSAAIGFMGGFFVGILLNVRVKKREVDEMEYIPVKPSKRSKAFFAEPVSEEDAFKEAKSVDDFITKMK